MTMLMTRPFGRNQCFVRLAKATSESIIGTFTRTPTTVASAAPEPSPKRLISKATASRAHIAVTFVTDRMSPRMRGRLIVFGWIIALLAVLPLIYASWRNLSGSWSSGEFYDGLLGIPRWPMKLVFLLGLVMMTIRLVLVALEDLAELQRTGTVTTQSHTEEESV